MGGDDRKGPRSSLLVQQDWDDLNINWDPCSEREIWDKAEEYGKDLWDMVNHAAGRCLFETRLGFDIALSDICNESKQQ